MRFDDCLSGRIAAFTGKLREALPSVDPGYHRWVAANYPRHACLMMQQRQRVIGLAWHCYNAVTGESPDREQIRRVITWAERNPFTEVTEHTAMELFVRLHSNVPVHFTVTTLVPRDCLKFTFPLVTRELVDN